MFASEVTGMKMIICIIIQKIIIQKDKKWQTNRTFGSKASANANIE